jgi:hypothetical protein
MSGDTEHATFVVEIHPAGYNATPNVPAPKCFRIEFDASQGYVDKSLQCPAHATEISLPLPPTTLPSLGDYIDEVRGSISRLPPGSRRNSQKVESAIAAVVRKHGATVDVLSTNSVVGVAIRRGQDHDCVFVRITDEVELWRPKSVYRLYGQAGETRCTSAGAIAGDEQQPPH